MYACRYTVAQKCESDLSISVGLEDDDLFKWRVCFQGPENTPFEGGLYEATLRFPVEFPYLPPKMVFKTEMFHPNSTPRPTQSTQRARSASPSCTRPSRTPSTPRRSSPRSGTPS